MIVMSHTTAFEYWRRAKCVPSRRCALPRNRESGIASSEDVEEALRAAGCVPAHFSRPFHVVNPGDAWKPSGDGVIVHSSSAFKDKGKLPERSFVRVGAGLYAPSPEFCFLQMAEFLDVDNLVFVGCEICSMYRYMNDSLENSRFWGSSASDPGDSKSLPKIKPLSNVALIDAFLRKCFNVRGKRKAQRAARYISSNAASPMEYMLAQTLCLPCMLGGYGLPAVALNHEIPLGRYAGKLTRKTTLIPDLFWAKAKLDVEYMSTKHHASRKDLAKDAERQNVLGHLGIRVIDATWDQFVSLKSMDAVALSIAKHLGKRIQPRSESHHVKKIYLHTKMLHYIRTGQFLQPGLYDPHAGL